MPAFVAYGFGSPGRVKAGFDASAFGSHGLALPDFLVPSARRSL
jgi:hypothetical protein